MKLMDLYNNGCKSIYIYPNILLEIYVKHYISFENMNPKSDEGSFLY